MAKTGRDASAALENWVSVNAFLRDASEQECARLLARERSGKRRVQFLLRIHARLNKTRAERERAELLSGK